MEYFWLWIKRFWDGEAGLLGALMGVLTLPIELIYRVFIGIKNRGYDSGFIAAKDPSIPVVSVGNLAIGGTGKTPFSGWLVSSLNEAGFCPALITRGYGSDEVWLHRLWNPEVLVIVDPHRFRGVNLAIERNADVAVLDDAFQHRAVGRQLDIVLVAAEHGTRDTLLPRGRLRERFRSLARADAIVVTRKTATRGDAEKIVRWLSGFTSCVFAQVVFEPSGWVNLDGSLVSPPYGDDLLAVTSIAGPEIFRDMVTINTSSKVESFAFRDHHIFKESDIVAILKKSNGRPIIITEKDAVKLKKFSYMLPDTYVLRLCMAWESGRDDLVGIIRDRLKCATPSGLL